MRTDVLSRYREQFQQEPLALFAPGRINLIGEHTDYNEGFVMPAAINLGITFALGLSGTDTCQIEALDLAASYEFDIRSVSPAPASHSWANYLLGICAQLQQAGFPLAGFRCIMGGNIPVGSGLSSSAAVECGLIVGLDALFDLELDRMKMAFYAQAAEHTYVGVQCGIMDQFASLFGKMGQVVQLDCRSMAYQYAPIDSQAYELLLCNTRVSHSLASSEYNTRRQECEAGVALLQTIQPDINSLRDVNSELLQQHQSLFSPLIYQRCSYVVEENERVEAAVEALRAGDMNIVGELMYASHHGLQHQYEVSCPELDFLVALSRNESAILGARMMGGGFGGCTLNLVQAGQAQAVGGRMVAAYEKAFDRTGEIYVAEISDGVHFLPQ